MSCLWLQLVCNLSFRLVNLLGLLQDHWNCADSMACILGRHGLDSVGCDFCAGFVAVFSGPVFLVV